MKNIFWLAFICIALASCASNTATNDKDSVGNGTGTDTASRMIDSTRVRSKPDTPGKSDGAGTGPTTGRNPGLSGRDSSGK